MQIHLNGEVRQLPAPCSLAHLIEQLQLGARRLAVERNGEIVPRSRYAETSLEDGDQLEIVQAIGGG
jgi:sulfur carrier protein